MLLIYFSMEEKQQVQKLFGQVIYEIRISKNLKQSDVAEAGRLDDTYVSDLERGNYMPSLYTVLKLAKGLQVSPSKLINKFEEKLSS